MRKLLALLAVAGVLTFGSASVYAQTAEEPATEMTTGDSTATEEAGDSTAVEETAVEEETTAAASIETEDATPEPEKSFHQVIKEKFIAGDAGFMAFVVICLVFGLAISIERILYLAMSTTNTKKLLSDVESALESGGVESAKEVCRNTSGPVASIFYQGLDRYTGDEKSLDMVEKSIISYGGVQLGQLEKGVSWISLFIALAPMLGFFGTVIGMIGAFDAIAAANNISPGIVAGGIGVALITTVSGLLVAMVLQVFYNYIVAKIDALTNDMEDASITLVDMLVKYAHKK